MRRASSWRLPTALADKYGMSEIASTHISLRVPGPTPTFLINPQGMLFSEITASDLVRVDLAGDVVGPSRWPPHRAGVVIHSAILEARPEANCVFHTHTPYASAVSSIECGLLPLSQPALRFYGHVAYHDYGRAIDDPLERSRLQEDLGNRWYMLLRNHGVLTLGKSAGQAFISAFYLEKACQIQVLAQSTGQPLVMVEEDTREHADEPREDNSWPALLRLLDREDPSYRE